MESPLNLHLYRYGQAVALPGISIGVARYTPRGVRREDLERKGYYQVHMPLLAPSRELVACYRKKEITHTKFASQYRKEMHSIEAHQAICLIAAVCQTLRVNLGCFCEDETRCHRSQLAKLIETAANKLPLNFQPFPKFSSPACSMPEIED